MKKSTEKTPDFTPTKSPRTCKDAIYAFLREAVASQRIKPLRPHPGKGHRTPVRRKHHPCGEAIRKLEGEGAIHSNRSSRKCFSTPGAHRILRPAGRTEEICGEPQKNPGCREARKVEEVEKICRSHWSPFSGPMNEPGRR